MVFRYLFVGLALRIYELEISRFMRFDTELLCLPTVERLALQTQRSQPTGCIPLGVSILYPLAIAVLAHPAFLPRGATSCRSGPLSGETTPKDEPSMPNTLSIIYSASHDIYRLP